MIDKVQTAGLTTRQKVTAGIVLVLIVVVIWQVIGLFSEDSAPAIAAAPGTPGAAPAHPAPQAAQLPPKQQAGPLSQREAELLRMQQETEAKYVGALNELQMLKVSREIAETNQAIMTAKLATITAEKNIVELLTGPIRPVTAASYAQGLVNPVSSGSETPPAGGEQSGAPTPPPITEVTYSVISVSQLQSRWNAVLGYQGNLYSVGVGDLLPPDGSKVVSISKSGVVLDKNGQRKRLSLVPII